MKKDTKTLLILGVVTLGLYFLLRKKADATNTAQFSNFISPSSINPLVLNQIPSGFPHLISQYVSPNADKFGKKWYAYVFKNTPELFVGSYPTPSSYTLATTNYTKVNPCSAFLSKVNQISIQYPNLQGYYLYLHATTQMPTNLCARDWWFKNTFGSEWIAPLTMPNASWTNASLDGVIQNTKNLIATQFPQYRIAIVRQ